MKRALKVVGVLIGVVVIAIVALVGYLFTARPAIPPSFDLGQGISLVKDGHTSFYVVDVGAGQVALIDAGNDRSGNALLAELSRRRLTPDAVQAVLLTHGHGDHLGAISVLPKAQVMALPADADLAAGLVTSAGPLPRHLTPKPTGVKVGRMLQDGETVTVGSVPFKVFAVPGHTKGSAAYFAKGVLFLGDSADATKDGKLAGAFWLFSDSAEQNKASLQRLAQQLTPSANEVRFLAFAHSGVLSGFAPLEAFASGR